jgi:hypothetical protein
VATIANMPGVDREGGKVNHVREVGAGIEEVLSVKEI